MADDGVEDLGADVEAGEVNNIDSTQPVQTESFTSRVQAITTQSPSIDTSPPNTFSNMPAVPFSGSTNTPPTDTAPFERQSLSRSMSRASSESTEGVKITTKSEESNQDPSNHTEGGSTIAGIEQSTGDSVQYVGNMPSLDPVSESSMNVSHGAVSSDNASMKNDMQGQSSTGSAQNGDTVHINDSLAGTSNMGASSSNGLTEQPSDSLPASSTSRAKPAVKDIPPTPTTPAPRARLPNDKIGILEDRIKEDPRGDVEAWLNLVEEHKKRAKMDDVRSVYDRFLAIFPSAAEIWLARAQVENEAGERHAMDVVLSKALPSNPYLHLWSMYLDHVRRHNNLTTDTTGDARKIIHQAYDIALQNVGLDKDSGMLWQDYVNFIKSGPGIIGGSNWQDQQKMDLLRKIYQRAICVPHQFTNLLWKEYDGFEMGLNKMTGRKFLQDQSPAYMSARSSYTELQNITRNLRRTTLPALPPAQGFAGDVEFLEQLNIWKRWIHWEKDDPLYLKKDDVASYRARILFVYKHAVMAMRFWPELWCHASDFCLSNDMESDGIDFLVQGIAANPESCLLAFKQGDRIEQSMANDEGENNALSRGTAVREPYNKVLDALYGLIVKSKAREAQEIARIEATFANPPDLLTNGDREEEDNEGNDQDEDESKAKEKAAQIEAVKSLHAAQTTLLSKTISHVWIALIRAMRRIQGKGKVNDSVAGLRGTFADARKRGRITSDVYSACALIEFHCYEVETGKKIFERGLKLFPEDEAFALEYIKHLVANNDHTNARVVFETAVTRLAQKPETIAKAKPLYAFFHDFEARYGELTQIMKLEKRMRDLYPDDPTLTAFSKRFIEGSFDPTVVRPIVSPATQTKPKIVPSVENGTLPTASPVGRLNPAVASPKRPLPLDDSDNENGRKQKIARMNREVSPLKGAAGRRLDQQKRNRPPQETPQYNHHPMPIPAPPPPLPRDVNFLLGIIPKAETYQETRFNPQALVRLIRDTAIPTHVSQLPPSRGVRAPPPPQSMPMSMPMPMPPYQQNMPMQQMPQGQYVPQYNGHYPYQR